MAGGFPRNMHQLFGILKPAHGRAGCRWRGTASGVIPRILLLFILHVSLFHPIALSFGIDPLHFGFIFVLDLVIGMLTPPVGVILFVVCGITGVRMGELVRESRHSHLRLRDAEAASGLFFV